MQRTRSTTHPDWPAPRAPARPPCAVGTHAARPAAAGPCARCPPPARLRAPPSARWTPHHPAPCTCVFARVRVRNVCVCVLMQKPPGMLAALGVKFRPAYGNTPPPPVLHVICGCATHQPRRSHRPSSCTRGQPGGPGAPGSPGRTAAWEPGLLPRYFSRGGVGVRFYCAAFTRCMTRAPAGGDGLRRQLHVLKALRQ